MEIGQKIRILREAHNMTQKELAERLGFASHSVITKMESGFHRVPYNTILKLSKVFNVTPNDLMGYKQPFTDDKLEALGFSKADIALLSENDISMIVGYVKALIDSKKR